MNFDVIFKGQVAMTLLEPLAKKQGLTPADITRLKRLHVARMTIFEKMEKTNEKKELKILVHLLENVEFDMQEAWGFEQDSRTHSWWWRSPKCTCSKTRNMALFGSNSRAIDKSCPLHGED